MIFVHVFKDIMKLTEENPLLKSAFLRCVRFVLDRLAKLRNRGYKILVFISKSQGEP